jgi:hypothetical protein
VHGRTAERYARFFNKCVIANLERRGQCPQLSGERPDRVSDPELGEQVMLICRNLGADASADAGAGQAPAYRADEHALAGRTLAAITPWLRVLPVRQAAGHRLMALTAAVRSRVVVTPQDGEAPTPTRPTTCMPDRR